MFSNVTNMRVAQNCMEYSAKSIISLLSVSVLSESCDNCQNYIKGKCTKGLFYEIMEIINRN